MIRIAMTVTREREVKDDCVIVSVHRTNGGALADEPELRVSSVPVSWIDLRQYLKVELSRRADRVVFVEGDQSLEIADIVRAIDIAQGAWPGVPVVLLTPALKRTLAAVCADASRDRVLTPLSPADRR